MGPLAYSWERAGSTRPTKFGITVFARIQPHHVAVNEILIRPTDQVP